MKAPTIRRLTMLMLALWATFWVPSAKTSGASLISFTALGSGISAGFLANCPTGLCPGTDSCICIPLSGSGKAASLGKLNFSTTFVLDTSNSIGSCTEGLGTLTLTSTTKAAPKIVMNFNGSVCSVGAGMAAGWTFNGAYFIDGTNSTGKFAGAAGSGNIAGSEDQTTGNILGNIDGTLLPQ